MDKSLVKNVLIINELIVYNESSSIKKAIPIYTVPFTHTHFTEPKHSHIHTTYIVPFTHT